MAMLLVSLGGAVGTALRYGLSLLFAALLPVSFPFGTLVCNVVGSLLLGSLMELGGERAILGVDARLVLGVGALGGFTTYSSFAVETFRMFDSGTLPRAMAYAALTTVLCLLAAALGSLAARRMF